jgi:hypothetical protein
MRLGQEAARTADEAGEGGCVVEQRIVGREVTVGLLDGDLRADVVVADGYHNTVDILLDLGLPIP